METSPEKENLRKFSSQQWIEEMKGRAERQEFDPWTDFITVEDYLNALRKYFGNRDALAGKRYLDVGAGFGSKLHELLRQHGTEIMNADISPESIRILKQRNETGIVADSFRLSFKEQALDGVIIVNLINTGSVMDREDLVDTFKEVHRILKKPGYLIQSHYGYFVQPIQIEEQLAAARDAGFGNIQIIENQLTRQLKQQTNLQPLTFIAEKI